MYFLIIVIGIVGNPDPLVMRLPVPSMEACDTVGQALAANLAARSGQMRIVCQEIAPPPVKAPGMGYLTNPLRSATSCLRLLMQQAI